MPFVCDMHNHLAVKTYLYNKPCIFDVSLLESDIPAHVFKLLKYYNPEVDVFRVLSTLPKAERGGVNAIIATHYVPENQFLSNVQRSYITLIKALAPMIFPDLLERLESRTDVFNQTLESLAVLEDKIEAARRAHCRVSIARSYAEMEAARAEGNIVLMHALEGAHHLGRDLPPAGIREAVGTLKARGVCYITLAHFFENSYTVPIEGLPPEVRSGFMKDSYKRRDREQDARTSLTGAGKVLAAEMFAQGIIVDLTHTSPQGRREVYEINRERARNGQALRPVIMSHVGVEAEFTRATTNTDRYLCASDEDIDAIKECDGVIGVIFDNYWLAGVMEGKGSNDFGIEYIYRTIEYIKERTGSCANIAIGSDFDGMTDTPDDYKDLSTLKRFGEYLRIHLSSDEVDAILGENMHRVLRCGWV